MSVGTERTDEIAASVAAFADLGPGYDQAVAEGLVERIGKEIDERITVEVNSRVSAEVGSRVDAELDSRVAAELDQYLGCRHARRQRRRVRRHATRQEAIRAGPSTVLALGSMMFAATATLIVLLTGMNNVATANGATRSGPGAGSIMLTALIWIVIGYINVHYAHKSRD